MVWLFGVLSATEAETKATAAVVSVWQDAGRCHMVLWYDGRIAEAVRDAPCDFGVGFVDVCYKTLSASDVSVRDECVQIMRSAVWSMVGGGVAAVAGVTVGSIWDPL